MPVGLFGPIRLGETMTVTAYLAGPDVFLPNAVAHAARKVEICRLLGLHGLPPLDEDVETAAKALDVWQAIYRKDIAMMERCDIIIANLTPFGGASADAGTEVPNGFYRT
jgi:nucleoside 2-deoxyribosyltransferase